MLKVRRFAVILFCVLAFVASAQKKKKSKDANSIEPYHPSKVYSPKAPKKKSTPTTYNARDKYYDRVKSLRKKAKQDEMVQTMRQGEYDLPYFGHKKKPKKRPPEKMKYCNICGIRH